MSTYKLYRKFNSIDQAYDFIKYLEECHIPSVLNEINSPLGSSFGSSGFDKHYEILIPTSEFARADDIVERIAEIAITNVEKDHYLFDFTNEELKEIQNNSDEWSEFDVKLSKHILSERVLQNIAKEPSSKTKIRATDNHKKDDSDDDPVGDNIWYYIGLAIFLLVASVYSFYSPNLINERELTTLKGNVKGAPYHYTHNDNPEYIKIDLVGQPKSFRIKGCALRSSYRQTLLELRYNDVVKFHVLKEELTERITPFNNNYVEVYAISINGNELLSLEGFNDCREVTWKGFLMLLPIVGIIFILMLWRRRSKVANN